MRAAVRGHLKCSQGHKTACVLSSEFIVSGRRGKRSGSVRAVKNREDEQADREDDGSNQLHQYADQSHDASDHEIEPVRVAQPVELLIYLKHSVVRPIVGQDGGCDLVEGSVDRTENAVIVREDQIQEQEFGSGDPDHPCVAAPCVRFVDGEQRTQRQDRVRDVCEGFRVMPPIWFLRFCTGQTCVG